MKTIAILTLTFLPGTAVASVFSMNGMFNWSPAPGGQIASPYLYVFFVVTVPLTIFLYIAVSQQCCRCYPEAAHSPSYPLLTMGS